MCVCRGRLDVQAAENADVTPPVVTLHVSELRVDFDAGDGAAGSLAPCASAAAFAASAAAAPAYACGATAQDDEDGDLSGAVTVQPEACWSCAACQLSQAVAGLCVPGRYAFLFSAADAAGNVGTARLRVAVVTRSTFSFVRVAASNASSLQEAEAEAEALVDAASATNVAYRGELAALLTSVAAVTAEAVWLEDVTVVWANATAEADGEWVVRMAVSVSAALAGDDGSNAGGGRGRRIQAVDDAVDASVSAMMAALEAGGATGVSSDGETRVDAARLAVVELQATLAQLKSSYSTLTLRLSTLVGAPPPPASFECGSSVPPPASLSLTVGECPSRTQNSDAGWPGERFFRRRRWP